MTLYGYLLPTREAVLSSEDGPTLAAKTESEVLDLASKAEGLGYDAVWVGDSVLGRPRLESLTSLAAVAAGTEAVDLGTAVYLPTLRHPVHVAHQTATVDQLSGGRLRYLGVGVGSGEHAAAEAANLDVSFDDRGARLDELFDVVAALWDGGPVDYDGEFYEIDGAGIGFEPVSPPGVYVSSSKFDPARGFPRRILERLVERGDGWLPIGIAPTQYEQGLATIRSALEAAGRDTETLDRTFYLDVTIDADEDRALEEARQFYRRYSPGWSVSDGDIRQRAAVGPPSTVAERLAAYEDAGVETFVVRFAARDQRTQLQRFSELVD